MKNNRTQFGHSIEVKFALLNLQPAPGLNLGYDTPDFLIPGIPKDCLILFDNVEVYGQCCFLKQWTQT